MHILYNIVIGGLVGWVASILMKTDHQMGKIANVIIGIVGAHLGFWLAGKLGHEVFSGLGRWVVAVLGAVILVWILKKIGVFWDYRETMD